MRIPEQIAEQYVNALVGDHPDPIVMRYMLVDTITNAVQAALEQAERATYATAEQIADTWLPILSAGLITPREALTEAARQRAGA